MALLSFAGKRMFGFVRRLFQRSASKSSEKEFFLNPDDAKSLGDIDYMRTLRTVRKTFPNIVGDKKEVVEVVEQISATEKVILTEGKVVPTVQASEPPPVDSSRRQGDSSLDSFRKMARDLGKS